MNHQQCNGRAGEVLMKDAYRDFPMSAPRVISAQNLILTRKLSGLWAHQGRTDLPSVGPMQFLHSLTCHTIHKNYKLATMYAFTKLHVCIYKVTCMHLQSYMYAFTKLHVCIYKVTCMHLQSYMYAFTKLHVCIYKVTIEKVDRVCKCVRAWVGVSDPRFIQFALGSCYAVHINALSIQ